MELNKDFWAEKWQKGEIGFNQETYHRHLVKFWHRLEVEKHSNVLVPLCGKSIDMLWLRDQGHKVFGVEIVEKAIEDFHRENKNTKNIEIIAADLLHDEEKVPWQNCKVVYDRASLIALNSKQRKQYYSLIKKYLPEKILLLVVEYDQSVMPGPPHSVTKSEIVENLGTQYSINLLASESMTQFFKGGDIELNLQANCYLLKI